MFILIQINGYSLEYSSEKPIVSSKSEDKLKKIADDKIERLLSKEKYGFVEKENYWHGSECYRKIVNDKKEHSIVFKIVEVPYHE